MTSTRWSVTLTAALSEMMTDDGPLPGSVLDTMLGTGDPFDKATEMLVFASQLLASPSPSRTRWSGALRISSSSPAASSTPTRSSDERGRVGVRFSRCTLGRSATTVLRRGRGPREVGARLDRHHDPPAVGEQRVDDGAAEASGAAGYECGAVGHRRTVSSEPVPRVCPRARSRTQRRPGDRPGPDGPGAPSRASSSSGIARARWRRRRATTSPRAVRAGGRPRRAARAPARSHDLRVAEPDEYALEDLLDGPRIPVERMEADLRELIATVQCGHLRALLDRVFGAGHGDVGAVPRGAGRQALPPGLPARAARALADGRAGASRAISATFGGVDRDVAVTGALLHDIGKLDAYTADPLAIDLTDLGKLQGEIPLGYYRVRRLIEDLPGFPPSSPSRCCTSSSATTASSSTARRSSPAPARRRSCT